MARILLAITLVLICTAILAFVLPASNSTKIAAPTASSSVPSSQSKKKILSSSAASSSCTAYRFGKPVTYEQRYQKCLELKKTKSQAELDSYFKQHFDNMMVMMTVAGRSPNQVPVELVLLRIHKRKFALDFWLNTCSILLETVQDRGVVVDPADDCVKIHRHTFLFTLKGHESSVPQEFKPFIKIHDEEKLFERYTSEIYTDGYQRGGDLASADFLLFPSPLSSEGEENSTLNHRRNGNYDFVWSIEHDIRFAGSSWGDLLFNSRFVLGKALPDLNEQILDNRNSEEELVKNILETTDTEHQFDSEFQCHEAIRTKQQKSPVGGDLSSAAKEAHLIFFYPPILNQGYYDPIKVRLQQYHDKKRSEKSPRALLFPRLVPKPNTWHFSQREYFRGTWKNIFVVAAGGAPSDEQANDKKKKIEEKKVKWLGGLMPFFGMSKNLAAAIVRDAKAGNSHVNQEVVLPVTAQIEKLKMISTHGCFSSQFYFSWHRKGETAPLYAEWADHFFNAFNNNNNNNSATTSFTNNKKFVPNDDDEKDFRSALKVPPIGLDFSSTKKKQSNGDKNALTKKAASFYGINTKEFVGNDQVVDFLVHPVKL